MAQSATHNATNDELEILANQLSQRPRYAGKAFSVKHLRLWQNPTTAYVDEPLPGRPTLDDAMAFLERWDAYWVNQTQIRLDRGAYAAASLTAPLIHAQQLRWPLLFRAMAGRRAQEQDTVVRVADTEAVEAVL